MKEAQSTLVRRSVLTNLITGASMTRTVVIDASVAVKWILPEPGHEASLRLLDLYQDEQVDLYAPYLLITEVGSVLWKRVQRGDLNAVAARRCFEQLLRD